MRVRPGQGQAVRQAGQTDPRHHITLSFPERPETREWAEAIKGQIERTLDVKVKTDKF